MSEFIAVGEGMSVLTSSMQIDPRNRAFIHNWLKIQPRPGLAAVMVYELPVQGYISPRRCPITNENADTIALVKKQPVWVCVLGIDELEIETRSTKCLVVFVDHLDHDMMPGYEYWVPFDQVNIIDSKHAL
jgi:hypothetical protein